jgi:hypothetical protein
VEDDLLIEGELAVGLDVKRVKSRIGGDRATVGDVDRAPVEAHTHGH